ncbi:uncharacterized protein LOC124702794 [Lolium rigidum]|uniref:uncharacterized protein LOC124702794 n=1 Tax=Lolium rigidum TaxID=89674 RepID=UPI001F5D42AF|nr:uncharacterized protein LOC124702794 [Lolium rigidum]
MAKVPDLGSDFAQKMLLDLRRRRERLGFGSAAQQQQRTSSNAATPRDICSNSQKPLRSQRPQQGAPDPRARRPEATTPPRSSQQPGNAIATAGKPRRRREVAPVAAADARAIVPFQEGGGAGTKHVAAGNVDVQMAALALALSDGGKLRNIEIMARKGSVFLRGPDTPGHHRGGAGGVAIGVQDLNDMLMAAYSSGGGRRRPDEPGKRLFGGSMDMEEALSMLVMLQDASGYMEGSGSGKVLLLKGKENRESSVTRSPSSARIVELVEEESETEQAKNASMQIVVHNKFQSHHSPGSSSVTQSGPSDSQTSNASEGEKDGSKVRMPSVIAKLMGLDNLPSSGKTVVERKGTERFVKPESVTRMEIRANAMGRKLPIRIVASEKVLSNGQHNIMLSEDWKNSLTSFRESELSNSSSHPATSNKHVRVTMREMLRKMVGAERGADGSQEVEERIIHEDKTVTEEIKLQKPVSVGCRSDSGKKMDFLKRFRKNSDSRPAMEDKHIAQEKSASVGKKQATGMKRLLGRDSEAKSRRAREKLNKENLATAETKVADPGKNIKADQIRRQAQSKHIERQTTPRKVRNRRETPSETSSWNLEDKNSLMSEAAHMKEKPEYSVVIQREDEEPAEVNDVSLSKPSDSTNGDGGFSEQLSIVARGSTTTREASSDQPLQKITEGASDPTIAVQANEELNFSDQSAVAEISDGRTSHTTSESTRIPETFTEEAHQQQQQQQHVMVKEQPTDGLDHTTTSTDSTGSQEHTTHVVSFDSFTDNQLLLARMLAKDRYLLETAKAIVRVHDPVSFIDDDNRLDKGNYDLLSDVAREVIRRKGKRTEALEDVSVACTVTMKLRHLDDLVRELDGDVESLDIQNSMAEGLQKILQSDIQNDHPDANSTWDFGWNRVSKLPIEKNEVVKDLEKNILGGIITDVARDLIGVSVRHGSCACVA